jgi:hypothetical protein
MQMTDIGSAAEPRIWVHGSGKDGLVSRKKKAKEITPDSGKLGPNIASKVESERSGQITVAESRIWGANV